MLITFLISSENQKVSQEIVLNRTPDCLTRRRSKHNNTTQGGTVLGQAWWSGRCRANESGRERAFCWEVAAGDNSSGIIAILELQ